MQTIEGRRNAHDFKYNGYSPTCDCGRCDCFGYNTGIIYGNKQICKRVYYYCETHFKEGLSNAKHETTIFIEQENKDRELKNLQLLKNIDDIISDKIIYSEKKCNKYNCKIIENLKQAAIYYTNCVCNKCSTYDTYCSGVNTNENNFTCPECNTIYLIKYKLDKETGWYEYVGCDNPYKIIGTCSSTDDDITRGFCTEINSNIKVLKPTAFKAKRKNKSKNIEDPTIPENIIDNNIFNYQK